MTQCSLPHALEAVGERWTFMILRAAFCGLRHFEEFLHQTGIARNILANRLSRLVDYGILARNPSAIDRRKVEYVLTLKGLDLVPALIALRQWGEKWGADVACTPILADRRDARPIRAVTLRAHDDRLLNPGDLCWIDAAGKRLAPDALAGGSALIRMGNGACGAVGERAPRHGLPEYQNG